MKPDTNESQAAWTPVATRPTEQDACEGCVWWWVPRMREAVLDLWDLPNDATHWMPGRNEEPLYGPNARGAGDESNQPNETDGNPTK